MDSHNTKTDGTSQRKELLDSWKEIACLLNRGVRTVQRWEREEHLPVHRHDHNKRATVFALASEVEDWMKIRQEYKPPSAQAKTAGSYKTVTAEELQSRCMLARARAQKVRRLVQLVYDHQQSEIARLIAAIKSYSQNLQNGR